MDSLTFLEKAERIPLRPVFVLHGDEAFLKRQALAAIQRRVLGEGDSFGLSTYAGDKASWSSVLDELQTLPFLSARRLVVVENADPFVTKHRAQLEKHFAKKDADAEPKSVLVLEVKSWPSNTKLAKMLDDAAVACKALPTQRLPQWCVQRAASSYDKQLTAAAAQLLVELVGPEMGQLDQELAKLAVYAGDAKRVGEAEVDALVGRSRTETVWKIFGAVGEGQPGRALAILDQMLDQGEDPMAILGGVSWQLRKMAMAYRLTRLGRSLGSALEEVGVGGYSSRGMEQQLRALGTRRAERLFDWLVEVDLGLKGGSQLPPRLLLERLIVNLARPA